ncbi:something about silencing protein 10 [Bicyclus anynana]|uniref:Something about silencing protein 10 n=1 Tax=Bicyclus anynana TaxID=110368 RepID=A0ABM3LQQ9_BICAN|nr:something about silencing protein 10 [Bicyclus anynana]
MADKIRFDSKFDVQNNYEPSDSENEYSADEKEIIEKLRKRKHQDSDSEEEVYGFSDSDASSENKSDLGIADSDLDGGDKSDDDLPDSKAWGKQKKSYYSTDYVDEDYGGFGDDEQDALMEEEEAKNIQKRLLEQLGEEDFSLEFFTKQIKSEGEDILIKHDVSQMSKRQKLQLFEKESPEFSGLIEDFKSKLTVAKDDLQPVLELVKGGKLPSCSASKFVKTNYELILNYCTTISFYLLLKSQKINIQNHPVIKRLYQYRQMLKKMEPIYNTVIKPQIDKILNTLKNNLELQLIKENKNKKRKSDMQSENPTKKLKLLNIVEKDDGEDTGVSDDDNSEAENSELVDNKIEDQADQSEESGFSDNDEPESEQNKPTTSNQVSDAIPEDVGDKREITYQIAKNKGLTPHRKKEQRNPRVKHKLKYRKAKIRRKGAIREPRTEITRYGGEPSGIKANVKKSIKIK